MKKLLSLMLSLAMVLCMMPAFALTAIAEETTQEKANELKQELEQEGTFYVSDMGAVKYLNDVYSKAAAGYSPINNGDMLPYATEFGSKFKDEGLNYSFTATAGDGFEGVAWMVKGTVDIKDTATTYATTGSLFFKLVQLLTVDSDTKDADIANEIAANIYDTLGINATVTKGESVAAFLTESAYQQGLDYYVKKDYVVDNLYNVTINSTEYKFFVTKDSLDKALGIEDDDDDDEDEEDPYIDNTNKLFYVNGCTMTASETTEQGYDAILKNQANQREYKLPTGYGVVVGVSKTDGYSSNLTVNGGTISKIILSNSNASASMNVTINSGSVGTIRIGDIDGGRGKIRSAYVYNNNSSCTPTLEVGNYNGTKITDSIMEKHASQIIFSGNFNVPDEVKALRNIFINSYTKLIYNANGGQFTGGEESYSEYGSELTTVEPVKENAEFLGWSTDPDSDYTVTSTSVSAELYAVYRTVDVTRPISVTSNNTAISLSFSYDSKTQTYTAYYWGDADLSDLTLNVKLYELNEQGTAELKDKTISLDKAFTSGTYERHTANFTSSSKNGNRTDTYNVVVNKYIQSSTDYTNLSATLKYGDEIETKIYVSCSEDESKTVLVPREISEIKVAYLYMNGYSFNIAESSKIQLNADTTTVNVVAAKDSDTKNYTLIFKKTDVVGMEPKLEAYRKAFDNIGTGLQTVKIADSMLTGLQAIELSRSDYFENDVLRNSGCQGAQYEVYEDSAKKHEIDLDSSLFRYDTTYYVELWQSYSFTDANENEYRGEVCKTDLVPVKFVSVSNTDAAAAQQINDNELYLSNISNSDKKIASLSDEYFIKDIVLRGNWYGGNWYETYSTCLKNYSSLSEANPDMYETLKGSTDLDISITSYSGEKTFLKTTHKVGLSYYVDNSYYGSYYYPIVTNALGTTTNKNLYMDVQSIITVPAGTSADNAISAAEEKATNTMAEYGSYSPTIRTVDAEELLANAISISRYPQFNDAQRAYLVDGGLALYSGESGTSKAQYVGFYKNDYADTADYNLYTGETLDYVNTDGEVKNNVESYQLYYISVSGLQGSYLLINQASAGHNLTHHEAVASTCTKHGSIEYWECTTCGKLFADKNCEKEITEADTVTELARHTWDGGTVTKEATTTESGTVVYECTECHTEKTETLGIVAKAEKEALSDNTLSDDLKNNDSLNTAAKVEAAMESKAKEQAGFASAEFTSYELVLKVSTDNGGEYEEAGEGNVPAKGVEVTIPYPEGKDSSYNFLIIHMYDETDETHTAGEMDVYDNPVKTEDGLRITMTSASPIQIASTPGDGNGKLQGTIKGYFGTGNVVYELISGGETPKTKTFSSKGETYSFAGLAKGQYTLRVSADGDYVAREYSTDVGDDSELEVTLRELGDTTMDGVRSAEDITRLARHVAKISLEKDTYGLKLYDVTKDDEVDAEDITHLARFVAKIIGEL